eukprot:TRINITY_DN1870_c3_g1_i1.p1 TRINITY_DN1870_c3_g1~~TRINITY_DN1870_c3_g1_i1.p1  ORF type:complete len:239 (-),score=56.91 TRINITY_DN1870_c3_g1_i1:206-898(-)
MTYYSKKTMLLSILLFFAILFFILGFVVPKNVKKSAQIQAEREANKFSDEGIYLETQNRYTRFYEVTSNSTNAYRVDSSGKSSGMTVNISVLDLAKKEMEGLFLYTSLGSFYDASNVEHRKDSLAKGGFQREFCNGSVFLQFESERNFTFKIGIIVSEYNYYLVCGLDSAVTITAGAIVALIFSFIFFTGSVCCLGIALCYYKWGSFHSSIHRKTDSYSQVSMEMEDKRT